MREIRTPGSPSGLSGNKQFFQNSLVRLLTDANRFAVETHFAGILCGAGQNRRARCLSREHGPDIRQSMRALVLGVLVGFRDRRQKRNQIDIAALVGSGRLPVDNASEVSGANFWRPAASLGW